MATEQGTQSPRGRRVALRVAAIVLTIGALAGMFGIAVVIGWVDNSDSGVHKVHDLGGFGAWAGIILAPAVAVQGWNARRRISSMQAIFGLAAAAAVAAGIAQAGGWLLAPALVLAAGVILLVLHPDRRAVPRAGRPSWPLALLTVAGAVPLVGFALSMAAFQRHGPAGDPHVSMNHWAAMATMALAFVATGGVAALRAPGWRLTGWTAGLGLAFFGLASVVFPDHAGSAGSAWGAAAIVGGLVFVAVAEWEARRGPAPAGVGGHDRHVAGAGGEGGAARLADAPE